MVDGKEHYSIIGVLSGPQFTSGIRGTFDHPACLQLIPTYLRGRAGARVHALHHAENTWCAVVLPGFALRPFVRRAARPHCQPNYNFCAAPKKVASPNKSNIEKTATTKAAIVAAVKESFAFCDSAYEIADAGLTEMVKSGQRDVGAGYPLTFNIAHNFEHYGNIVTYMRLKGLVPPSSAAK